MCIAAGRQHEPRREGSLERKKKESVRSARAARPCMRVSLFPFTHAGPQPFLFLAFLAIPHCARQGALAFTTRWPRRRKKRLLKLSSSFCTMSCIFLTHFLPPYCNTTLGCVDFFSFFSMRELRLVSPFGAVALEVC